MEGMILKDVLKDVVNASGIPTNIIPVTIVY